jgi:predicted aspartyl protease
VPSRIAFALASALLLGSAAVAQQVTPLQAVGEPQPVDSQTQTQDIGLGRDVGDRMTVPVRVSGSGPFRFMVDTGADRTAISRQVAERLRLRPGAVVNMHSVTGEARVRTARVDRIDYSVKRFAGVEAVVLEAEHIGADGILGTDSLTAQRVQFDFANDLMSITSGRQKLRDEPETIVVRARRRSGRLIVTEAYANGRPITVVVDTGSEVSIGNAALYAMLQQRRLLREQGMVELTSVTGAKLTGDYTFLRKLELGGVTLTDLGIVFADAHTFRQMKLTERPALLLGMNAMRAFDKVSIDFASRKLRVVLPGGSEQARAERLALRGSSGPAVQKRQGR